MLIRKILCMLLFITGVIASTQQVEVYLKQLENLTPEQKSILLQAYQEGSKYGYGYELATIAWKESGLGLYLVNISDGKYGSYGIYHIRLDYSLIRNNITSSWGKSRHMEKLLLNHEAASKEVVYILNKFKQHIKSKDKDTYIRLLFTMYNGGTGGINRKTPLNYGSDALIRYKAIQKYLNLQTDIHLAYSK